MNLVLASSSPRRAALLRSAGLIFDQMHPTASETWEGIAIEAVPGQLAERKAQSLAQVLWEKDESTLVLGADTIVVMGDRLLGKPRTLSDAKTMIEMLSARTHRVLTGYCIMASNGTVRGKTLATDVTFKKVSQEELDFYLATKEWIDKAGGYGIQGAAAFMVESIQGSYTNVVGLPLAEVLSDLADMGLYPTLP